jgi:hypothetical protein
LPTSTRQGWKDLPGTNAPASLAWMSVTKKKGFYTMPTSLVKPRIGKQVNDEHALKQLGKLKLYYTITIIHQLSIYTSMKHSLL